jgi:tripartite-type tricarboxylate transporter receptor subunit TctC
MKCLTMISIAVLALSVQAATAAPDSFPSRPLKIVVPMPPGSAPDIRLRLVAQQLTKTLGQQVVVENRAGGAGVIGVQAVLSSEPDGHTLLAAPASIFTILPAQLTKLAFDVNRDLIAIGTFMAEGQVVAATTKLNVSTFSRLLALAESRPDTISIGTNPAGSLPHLAAQLIVMHSKAPMTIVPFSQGGTNAAIREVLGGRIHVVIDGRPGLKAALDSGDLQALAIMTRERLPAMPDLPTAAETLPGVTAVGWFALCAPRGTSAEIVRKIEQGLRAALESIELSKRVEQIGTPFRPMFGPELVKFIEGEQKLWHPIAARQ